MKGLLTLLVILYQVGDIVGPTCKTLFLSILICYRHRLFFQFFLQRLDLVGFARRAPRGGEEGEYSPALIFDWNFVPYFYLKCPILCPTLT